MALQSSPGRAVIITGAGSGIGEASAMLLARNGARIALLGRTPEKVERVAGCIRIQSGEARAFACDLRRSAEATRAIDQAAGWLGHVDLLVNCAGVYREGAFADLSDRVVDDLLDTNVKGLVYVTRAALPWMRAGAAIINIASMSGVRALDEQCLYAASKAAVIHLGRCLARELAPRGIRVNTLSPGPTRTPIVSTVAPAERVPEIEASLARRTPLGRIGEPDEIAEAVAYLAESSFATGTHLLLDGGITL